MNTIAGKLGLEMHRTVRTTQAAPRSSHIAASQYANDEAAIQVSDCCDISRDGLLPGSQQRPAVPLDTSQHQRGVRRRAGFFQAFARRPDSRGSRVPFLGHFPRDHFGELLLE